jgi:superfamily II DNA or RNA helicase/HKD family nuclease
VTLRRGLYERLITDLLESDLSSAAGDPLVSTLRDADAADRLARHVGSIVERAIDHLPLEDRLSEGAALANTLLQQVASTLPKGTFSREQVRRPPAVLRAIRQRHPDGSAETIEAPLIPLLDTALLTNAPGEPSVGHQLRTEIASADRIDLVMAFIRRSGMMPFNDALRKHVRSGRKLRVLTTTFTGSTEAEAIELLQQIGAEVRVSYDTSSARLHAKAWFFHRESGFSTAYIGSSNLTHTALQTGLEWNVRVSGVANRSVIEKIAAVIESYWQQDDFAPYSRERFEKATNAARDPARSILLSPLEVRLEPFQERLIDQIAVARARGHHRNLLVAATGTGKTVMAAVDYARLRNELPRSRLLFVAHREELLDQSRRTFAHVLRDGNFGELWVGGRRPTQFEHVFASIQSLNASGVSSIDSEHFDVVIIDEFHHAAASTYATLLDRLKPRELIGLTATPERSDGKPILQWFDGRIAAELRLWDAIDQHRLTPFSYYGIADDLELRDIPWKRGTGYDLEALTNRITGTDMWARRILSECSEHVGRLDDARALGFCVSVAHARYMARIFNEHNVRSVAVTSDTPDEIRQSALDDLRNKRLNVVFAVDLFNEGVDVPQIDTLLLLRPTESPLLFLQQLGRGLRRYEGKEVCTVLDFVGQHRKEFRYDRRFRALLGGSRAAVLKQIEEGFPFLPAGCHMQLDRVASERVIESIKRSVPSRWAEKAAELKSLADEHPGISLTRFLDESGMDLDDVYSGNRSWSDLKQAARLSLGSSGPHEAALRRACGRLLHVDDWSRLNVWRAWLRDGKPHPSQMSLVEKRLLRMLLAQVLDQATNKQMSLDQGASVLWKHPQVCAELVDLFDTLSERISHVARTLDTIPNVPLQIHARYTRHEILAACGEEDLVKTPEWREGVRHLPNIPADVFAFTLDKTQGQFSPTTRYRDYAINPQLIHWESQSTVRETSPTGTRYQNHRERGNHILLFARLNVEERSFYFLGPASYVSHSGELPMAITWHLAHKLPGDLFAAFAAAVA